MEPSLRQYDYWELQASLGWAGKIGSQNTEMTTFISLLSCPSHYYTSSFMGWFQEYRHSIVSEVCGSLILTWHWWVSSTPCFRLPLMMRISLWDLNWCSRTDHAELHHPSPETRRIIFVGLSWNPLVKLVLWGELNFSYGILNEAICIKVPVMIWVNQPGTLRIEIRHYRNYHICEPIP